MRRPSTDTLIMNLPVWVNDYIKTTYINAINNDSTIVGLVILWHKPKNSPNSYEPIDGSSPTYCLLKNDGTTINIEDGSSVLEIIDQSTRRNNLPVINNNSDSGFSIYVWIYDDPSGYEIIGTLNPINFNWGEFQFLDFTNGSIATYVWRNDA